MAGSWFTRVGSKRSNRSKDPVRWVGRLVRPLYRPLITIFGGFLFWLLRVVPIALVKPIAWVVGIGGYYGSRILVSSRIMDNLEYAFGTELSLRERRRLYRRAFMNQTLCLCEAMALSRDASLMTDRLSNWEDTKSRIEAARAEGKGVILLCAHVGSWEYILLLFGAYFPMRTVVKRTRNDAVNRLMCKVRCSLGQRLMYHDESPRILMNTLRDNEVVMIVGDRAFRGVSSMDEMFFGHRTAIPTSPFALARKTGAPLLFSIVVRDPDGQYRTIQSPPMHVPNSGDREEDIREVLREWAQFLESTIREHPDQWLPMLGFWKKMQARKATAAEGLPQVRARRAVSNQS